MQAMFTKNNYITLSVKYYAQYAVCSIYCLLTFTWPVKYFFIILHVKTIYAKQSIYTFELLVAIQVSNLVF